MILILLERNPYFSFSRTFSPMRLGKDENNDKEKMNANTPTLTLVVLVMHVCVSDVILISMQHEGNMRAF